MFVKNKPQAGSILSFKLINGDEIVARLTDNNSTRINLSSPLRAEAVNHTVKLTPYLLTAQTRAEITIDRSNILAMYNSSDDVLEQYRTYWVEKSHG